MEETTAIAEVVGVMKQPYTLEIDGLEEPIYAIQAKMYLPANKYSNDLFRVKISKPIDLADRGPSVMEHGIF
jgi:hypothetical protein